MILLGISQLGLFLKLFQIVHYDMRMMCEFFACQGSGQTKTRSLLAERPGQELAWLPGRAHPLLLGHGVIRAFLVRGRGVFHLRGFVAVGGRLVFQESLPVGAGRRKLADGLEIATLELQTFWTYMAMRSVP